MVSADGLVGARRELCRVKVEVLNRRGRRVRRGLILIRSCASERPAREPRRQSTNQYPASPASPAVRIKRLHPMTPRPRAGRRVLRVLRVLRGMRAASSHPPCSCRTPRRTARHTHHVFLDEIRPDVTNAECARGASGSAARTVCNNRRVPPRRLDTSRGAG